jgi:hypothetical protein
MTQKQSAMRAEIKRIGSLGVCRALRLLVVGLLMVSSPPQGRAAASPEVPDIALLDSRGRLYQLRRAEARVIVLFFTANEWIAPSSGRRFQLVDASTEEPLGSAPEAVEAGIDRAVAAARAAFDDPTGWASWARNRWRPTSS